MAGADSRAGEALGARMGSGCFGDLEEGTTYHGNALFCVQQDGGFSRSMSFEMMFLGDVFHAAGHQSRRSRTVVLLSKRTEPVSHPTYTVYMSTASSLPFQFLRFQNPVERLWLQICLCSTFT